MTDQKSLPLAQRLIAEIQQGVWKPHSLIPSAREIARGCMGVPMSLMSAHRAQQLVTATGMVVPVRGIGIKVLPPAEWPIASTG